MTQRITLAHVEAKVNIVNGLLGFNPDEVSWNTDGAICLNRAYGATGVAQYSGTGGGVRTLMPLGTMREAANFLSGMIHALRLDNVHVEG